MTRPRPINSIALSSPLIQSIKNNTIDGSRYAVFDQHLSFAKILPSNQEALLKIKSIHSYNSRSSENYHNQVLESSDSGTQTYGRHFKYLDSISKIRKQQFRLSGVSLLISKNNLEEYNFKKIDTISDINIYQLFDHPILILQTSNYSTNKENHVDLVFPIQEEFILQNNHKKEFDDLKIIKLIPNNEETILFLSQ